jgi:uncharacterized peroxidase-related enzyme
VPVTRRRQAARSAQPRAVVALRLPIPPRRKLPQDLQRYFGACEDALGFLPNVLSVYSFDETKLRAFIAMYNDLMLGRSRLSKLEREMIAVVVSATNRCYYCLTAHGHAVRELSGDPSLGETLALNYRVARLPRRQRAMLAFAHALTIDPAADTAAAHHKIKHAGFSDRDIWDIISVTAFFNMTNRVAAASDMMPNREYLAAAR